MRIAAGELRGRPIAAPAGQTTRPTSDRARQAVFNILEHAPWSPGLEGARAIDLFAGSGAMGLEALSRGAAACLFVETARPALGVLRRNVETLGIGARARVLAQDATKLGPRPVVDDPFDLAFLDPPYGKELGEAAVAALQEGGWMAEDGLIVLERSEGEGAPDLPGWEVLDERRYGAARVWFLRLKD